MGIFRTWLDRRKAKLSASERTERVEFHYHCEINSAGIERAKFIRAAAVEMLRIDPTMKVVDAFVVASNSLSTFLHNEKTEFGHPDYDWSEDAAADFIREWEIDHWETAA